MAEDRRAALRTPAVFAVKKSFAGHISLCQAEDIGPFGITAPWADHLASGPPQIACDLLLANAVVGQRFELEDGVQIVRLRDPIEQPDRRESAGYQSMRWPPLRAARDQCHARSPVSRRASRQDTA